SLASRISLRSSGLRTGVRLLIRLSMIAAKLSIPVSLVLRQDLGRGHVVLQVNRPQPTLAVSNASGQQSKRGWRYLSRGKCLIEFLLTQDQGLAFGHCFGPHLLD